MTRQEFMQIMAYLSAAIGKPMADDPSEASARAEVFWDLLGDLPAEALRAGAKRVALEHPWATFPSVAELRAAAIETMRGNVTEFSAGEAWGIATRACWSCDVDSEGSVDRAMAGVPDLVREAIAAFGFRAIYNPGENVEVMRAQFTKIYDALLERDKRHALFPASLKATIREIGRAEESRLPAPVAAFLEGFGAERS